MCMSVVADIRKNYRDVKSSEDSKLAEVAQKMLDLLEGDKGFPVKVVELSRKLGFEIYRASFEDEQQSGVIIVDSALPEKMEVTSSKVIFLNRNDSTAHQRFAVAHELGHYIFDYDEENTPTYRETYITNDDPEKESNEKERRVNRFAAELLMPKDDFIHKFRELKKRDSDFFSLPDAITELKDYFDVPAKSVEIRLRETACLEEVADDQC